MIGITTAYDTSQADHYQLRHDYVRSVELAGGLPVILAPVRPGAAPELLARLDGLLLSGGADLDPAIYGEERHPSVRTVVRERDDFELALAREALDRDLPLLAICRGQQVLNVALGGTLVQDIPSHITGGVAHDPKQERWEIAHPVRIEPGTRLHRILGIDRVAVNSFHHQSVKQLGRGLVVSARSADDVVEGIELPDRRLALGVQWHPESFWRHGAQFGALFGSLVEACG